MLAKPLAVCTYLASLQQFPSYTMLKSMRKSKNRNFYHISVSPGNAPGAITLSVVWMEREFDAYKLARRMYHLSSTVSQLFKPQLQKIAVFTYRSPHLCFPWRRPCNYHAICCMDGKTIQCLPNSSQHVPIYLQQFPSYTMRNSMRKSKSCYFYHISVPLGTPLGQSR